MGEPDHLAEIGQIGLDIDRGVGQGVLRIDQRCGVRADLPDRIALRADQLVKNLGIETLHLVETLVLGEIVDQQNFPLHRLDLPMQRHVGIGWIGEGEGRAGRSGDILGLDEKAMPAGSQIPQGDLVGIPRQGNPVAGVVKGIIDMSDGLLAVIVGGIPDKSPRRESIGDDIGIAGNHRIRVEPERDGRRRVEDRKTELGRGWILQPLVIHRPDLEGEFIILAADRDVKCIILHSGKDRLTLVIPLIIVSGHRAVRIVTPPVNDLTAGCGIQPGRVQPGVDGAVEQRIAAGDLLLGHMKKEMGLRRQIAQLPGSAVIPERILEPAPGQERQQEKQEAVSVIHFHPDKTNWNPKPFRSAGLNAGGPDEFDLT